MQTDDQPSTTLLVLQRGDPDMKLIRSALGKVGFKVVNSENGSELPALLAARNQPLRLVVADPTTPGLDFRQLLKKLHETASDVRVLCVCDEAAEDALHVGEYADHIGGHLQRPFRRAHLLASILEATDKPLARTA